MAILNNETVEIGRIGDLILVDNKNPHPRANKKYLALRIQDASGRETTLLFTDAQLQVAKKRAKRNPEDIPKAENLLSVIRDFLD